MERTGRARSHKSLMLFDREPLYGQVMAKIWERQMSDKSLMCRAGVGFLRERKEIMKWRMLQIYEQEIGNVPTNVLRDYTMKTSNVYIICLCSGDITVI